jgi:hypothetical protein
MQPSEQLVHDGSKSEIDCGEAWCCSLSNTPVRCWPGGLCLETGVLVNRPQVCAWCLDQDNGRMIAEKRGATRFSDDIERPSRTTAGKPKMRVGGEKVRLVQLSRARRSETPPAVSGPSFSGLVGSRLDLSPSQGCSPLGAAWLRSTAVCSVGRAGNGDPDASDRRGQNNLRPGREISQKPQVAASGTARRFFKSPRTPERCVEMVLERFLFLFEEEEAEEGPEMTLDSEVARGWVPPRSQAGTGALAL